jgi:hypothetical protein
MNSDVKWAELDSLIEDLKRKTNLTAEDLQLVAQKQKEYFDLWQQERLNLERNTLIAKSHEAIARLDKIYNFIRIRVKLLSGDTSEVVHLVAEIIEDISLSRSIVEALADIVVQRADEVIDARNEIVGEYGHITKYPNPEGEEDDRWLRTLDGQLVFGPAPEGTGGGGTPGASTLNDLLDVNVASSQNGFFLRRVNNIWTGVQLVSSHISNFSVAVRATVLEGFNTASASLVSAADTIVQAIGKLQAQISLHTSNTSNPHNTTKAQVGLANVDNTSDINKPISTVTQQALDLKSPLGHLHNDVYISSPMIRNALVMTKSQYDNIGTKDPNTYYIIIQNSI